MNKIFYITERDKQILVALLVGVGIILFWRGLWGIADETPILSNFWVSLFVGLVILLFTGTVFTQFAGKESIYKATRFIAGLKRKYRTKDEHETTIYYTDKYHPKKVRRFKLSEVRDIEKNLIIIKLKNREHFVPGHRITKITKGEEVLWQK